MDGLGVPLLLLMFALAAANFTFAFLAAAFASSSLRCCSSIRRLAMPEIASACAFAFSWAFDALPMMSRTARAGIVWVSATFFPVSRRRGIRSSSCAPSASLFVTTIDDPSTLILGGAFTRPVSSKPVGALVAGAIFTTVAYVVAGLLVHPFIHRRCLTFSNSAADRTLSLTGRVHVAV